MLGQHPSMSDKILISACLLGHPVRYDGQGKRSEHPLIAQLRADGRQVAVCPELAAGFATPRPEAKILGGTGVDVLDGSAQIYERTGRDVTDGYVAGGVAAVDAAQTAGCSHAILMDGSPSSGSTEIYSGDFAGERAPGHGVTAAQLHRAGVQVWAVSQLDDLAQVLADG